MKNKPVLYTIIILLIIFIPLTILGFFYKEKPISISDENPKHFPYYNNSLWFYQHNKLISKYECLNEKCSYNIKNIINNKYVFIKDGDILYLYDINKGIVYDKYLACLNEDNKYICESDKLLWGVLDIFDEVREDIPFIYESINFNKNKYIVKKDNKYYLVDEKNNNVTKGFISKIEDFNNTYVISKENGRYRIYDFDGNEYLSNYIINNYSLSDNYIGIVYNNNLYIYNNINNLTLKEISLSNINSKVKLEEKDHKLNIYLDDLLHSSIELS